MHGGYVKWATAIAFGLLLVGSVGNLKAAEKFKVTRGSDGKYAPITAAELALTEVPGEENAPAVILFHKGRVRFRDRRRNVLSSTMRVETRIKVLTEAGLEHADWAITYHESLRLRKLEARTVLPDGTVLPVNENSIFERRSKVGDSSYNTLAIAFPSVEPGAILDYRFEWSLGGANLAPHWEFQSTLPTLFSEIEYLIPHKIAVDPWGRSTFNRQMHDELKRSPKGRTLRVWMENLPAVPVEPYGFPMYDLSSRYDLLLTANMKYNYKLFTDWDTTCHRYKDWYYRDARKKGKAVREKAWELIAGVSAGREAAEAIYRFLRDDIATRQVAGIYLYEGSTLDKVLEEKEGSFIEKALALELMLREIGFQADLVWTRSRFDGLADMRFANPGWFDRAVVRLTINGESIYLDPGDRRNAFGQGRVGAEGMEALVLLEKGAPQIIELPMSAPEDNLRRAVISLEIGEEGVASGTGWLTLLGHRARAKLEWKESIELTREAWMAWLHDRLPGFDVSAVSVIENRDAGRVEVTWQMAQPEEEVLGDEVTLFPSMPLGPLDTQFTLLTSQRRTPVLLAYRSRDEVEWSVRWPERFVIDGQPEPVDSASTAGLFSATVDVSLEERRLTFKRVFVMGSREYLPGREYGRLRSLHRKTAKSDARPVVLAEE